MISFFFHYRRDYLLVKPIQIPKCRSSEDFPGLFLILLFEMPTRELVCFRGFPVHVVCLCFWGFPRFLKTSQIIAGRIDELTMPDLTFFYGMRRRPSFSPARFSLSIYLCPDRSRTPSFCPAQVPLATYVAVFFFFVRARSLFFFFVLSISRFDCELGLANLCDRG